MPSATKRKAKATSAPPASASSESSRAWSSLNPPLSPWVLSAISSMGFEKMTPVQASTIPLFMGNKDVVVEAVTGSGKTLAFLIPVVERVLRAPEQTKKGSVSAVVVSPTRELASQIHSVLLSLLEFHGPSSSQGAESAPPGPRIKPLLLLGGNTSPAQDLKNFLEQSPNVLIGTPGRLNDLLSSPHVHCSTDSFEALVLDEADRLLDLGFKETLTKIISRLPKQRRTGLFSATVSDAMVGSLVRAGLRNPVKIIVKVRGDTINDEKRTPASLQMAYLLATPAERLVYLPRILQHAAPQKCIIYLSNCASVDYYAPLLPRILDDKTGRYSIVPLHGKQSPSARTRFFKKFVDSVTPSILLTTDLAARGLDVPSVDLVLQLDAPTDPKAFLHRCGRAGRAGRRGLAVLFLSPGREEDYLSFLTVRKTPVALLSLPECAAPTREDVNAVVGRMRAAVLQDRALHDRATKAFVSHVRAHSKHQTASIFRVQDLDWEDLARAFAMVRMPRMPELKGVDVQLGVDIDMSTYAYKDKVREAQRVKGIEEGPKERRVTKEEAEAKKKKYAAWSEKTEGKETKEARRAKKRKRREAEREAKMAPEERAKDEEWKELVEAVKRQRKDQEAAKEEEFMGLD